VLSYHQQSPLFVGNTEHPWRKVFALTSMMVVFTCGAVIVMWLVAWQQQLPSELETGCQAGWAVANGKPLYNTVEQYHGTPLIAVLLAPLAMPVAGYSRVIPAPLVMLFWYILCVVAWVLAVLVVHRLDAGGSRARYYLTPLLLLLPLGISLTQGRPDMLVVTLLLLSVFELRANRSSGAGLLLAAACTLEILCLVTILVSITERDRRLLYATMIGLLMTLLLLPALVFGLERTSLLNQHYFRVCWSGAGLLPVGMAHLLAIWCIRQRAISADVGVDEVKYSNAA
jgi:hypothetical protein